jgi:ADP-heptose:LPS heptosyltransferase
VSLPVALVLRGLYLGDMITALPALRMVRSALPEHRIVLAAPAGVGALAMMAGSVDGLTAALELAELADAPRGAEVAIDLHGNGPGSRALLEHTGAQRIVSYHGGRHLWRADEHEVARWCRLVGEAFGVEPPWPRLAGSMPVPAALAGSAGRTVVHPGAKAGSRRWPARRYAEVAERLREAGHAVVVTAGPGEERLAADVAAPAGVDTLTGIGLAELLAVVAHARVVVCADTGIAHVASLFATPSVVLFGPVPPSEWGPPPDGPHQVLWPTAGHRGDPHGDRLDPVLRRITADDVVGAVVALERSRATL